jgi:hypothetical protein
VPANAPRTASAPLPRDFPNATLVCRLLALRIVTNRDILPTGGMGMKLGLLAFVPIAALVLSATPAPAFFWWDHATLAVILDWPGYSVLPPGTTFENRVVTGYYTHWYQQEVPTVVPRVTYKLETVPVRTYVHVPKVYDEVETYYIYVPVPRLAAKEITTQVVVPQTLSDPTGHAMHTSRVEIKTHRVSYPVFDYQVVAKQRNVKVTRLVPEERVTEYTQYTPIVSYEQALTKEWQPLNVPYQQIVTVPVFDPHHAPQLFWP